MSHLSSIPLSPPLSVSRGGHSPRPPPRLDCLLALFRQVDRLLVGLRWRRLEEPLGFIKVLQWVSRP